MRTRASNGSRARQIQELIAGLGQHIAADAAGILQLQIEAAGIAEAPDQGRRADENTGVADPSGGGLGALGDHGRGFIRRAALAPVAQQRKGHAGILAIAGKAAAGHRQHIDDRSGVGQKVLFELVLRSHVRSRVAPAGSFAIAISAP